MARVHLASITKVYDGSKHAALSVPELVIEDKEFVVLVGPSGCGKSTTLRIIAGLEQPTTGVVMIDDHDMTDTTAKDRGTAMVFQNYALYPHLDVFDNMAFGLKLRKTKKDEIKARVNEAADILRIRHLLDRRPRQLSGGERQRVAVGRTIVRHPSVFLFDEPLSNLDAKLRAEMRAELKELHGRLQATMVYVTHDQVEAMTMGDRVVVMKDGTIQQAGTPKQVYHDPANAFVAAFMGSPPMNLVHVRNVGAVLGIRPEHVRLPADASDQDAFPGVIELVERCGAVDHVHVRLLSTDDVIVASMPPDSDITNATWTIPVGLPLEHVVYFNDKDGRRIG